MNFHCLLGSFGEEEEQNTDQTGKGKSSGAKKPFFYEKENCHLMMSISDGGLNNHRKPPGDTLNLSGTRSSPIHQGLEDRRPKKRDLASQVSLEVREDYLDFSL